MNLDTILATATTNGWSDDSEFTRATITSQIGARIDGWLATVKVMVSGEVAWGVVPTDADGRTTRGTATTIDDAMRACHEAVSAGNGTLF